MLVGLILPRPVVHEGLLDAIPAGSALGVFEHGASKIVLPTLRRRNREALAHTLMLGIGVFLHSGDQRIVGLHLIESLEGGGETHILGYGILALF